MPRPRKCRRVCAAPGCKEFAPPDSSGKEAIVMALDEYEAIRLIDLAGMTQEQCAVQMGVARTTAQAIYTSARRKLAMCIVHGRCLQIGGGDVQLCQHRQTACGFGCCHRWTRQLATGKEEEDHE